MPERNIKPETVSWKVYSNADLSDMPIIYGFSKYVIPRPNDWKNNVNVTGYWFLDNDSNWKPLKDLLKFIESGQPPIYFGFGSMIDKEILIVTKIIVESLEKTSQRGILSCGWNKIEEFEVPPKFF